MSKSKTNSELVTDAECSDADARAINDALEALSGKWKLQIMIALSTGPKRFRQIAKEVPDITDRMLSKELKLLESHLLVERTVINAFPPQVEYSPTAHAFTLRKVMMELSAWGKIHRKKILGK